MKIITMVDLRTHSERIVRDLARGIHMTLSYRGKPVAELVPVGGIEAAVTPLAALDRAQSAASADSNHVQAVTNYVRELREDQKAWGERP